MRIHLGLPIVKWAMTIWFDCMENIAVAALIFKQSNKLAVTQIYGSCLQ